MNTEHKARLRQLSYAVRAAQTDKPQLSQQICRQLLAHPAYQAANTVLWYCHCRSEVQTLPALAQQLTGAKRIIVPYCTRDADDQPQLGLWHLQALDELQAGMWGILEPPPSRWQEAAKQVKARELDVVIVPGVAFGRDGARLGNGAGYYDRLLQQVREDAVLIGIGYESQILADVPMAAHDMYLDFVITERGMYSGRRQA